MKLKGFAFIILLMMILVSGGMASGQCEPSDGNNTEADATQIGFSETVSDWVCPDDPFDFYVLEIPEGADVSGRFTFSSPQRSTVLRIQHADTGVRVIDDAFTTDERREFTVRMAAGTVPPGTYYARVFFWSEAAFDHEYSLTIDLSVTGLPECVPDGNEDGENASETSFGNTVADWVCSVDHLDIWHFTVATDAEGNGTINLTADPGELILYLYDSTEEELFRGRTSDGVLEYDLNSGGAPLVAGDYYIGVFLPFARDDENAYTLALNKYISFIPVGDLLILQPGLLYTLPYRLPEESQPEFQLQINPEFLVQGQVQMYQPEIFTRIVVDSLYCVSESTWDHATNSDEPYAIINGFATHTEPHAWYTGRPQVFGNVDDHENRRFTWPQRVVFEGDVPPDAVIGFTVVLMEQDASDSSIFRDIGDAVADEIDEIIALCSIGGQEYGVGAAITTAVTDGVIWVLAEVLDGLVYLFGGGADDKVAEATEVVDYEDLKFYSGEPHKTMETKLYGGSEGKYILRWHLEFDPLASLAFSAEFTSCDAFAVGKLRAGSEDVILTVIDEDAPGNNGRFYIRNALGFLLTKFDAFYTPYDRVVCGDINGDGTDEIVVASDDGGGRIRAYDSNGVQVMSFDAPYTKYDGLAVANVYGDEKCEILLATDDNMIFTYDKRGTKLREMHMIWDFNGVRNTYKKTKHDEFLVGDVMGNGDLEIVMLENKKGADSLVHIYAANCTSGQTLRILRIGDMGGIFTKYDAACLADITGDEKLELIIATDGGDKGNGYKIKIYDLRAGFLVATRYWPLYTKYDGFAAGDVLGSGKDQILCATDEDNKVYISQ